MPTAFSAGGTVPDGNGEKSKKKCRDHIPVCQEHQEIKSDRLIHIIGVKKHIGDLGDERHRKQPDEIVLSGSCIPLPLRNEKEKDRRCKEFHHDEKSQEGPCSPKKWNSSLVYRRK